MGLETRARPVAPLSLLERQEERQEALVGGVRCERQSERLGRFWPEQSWVPRPGALPDSFLAAKNALRRRQRRGESQRAVTGQLMRKGQYSHWTVTSYSAPALGALA